MKTIEQHNKKESSYKLGITEFADLTWEEFEQGYLLEPMENLDYNEEGEKLTDVKPIDWREKKVVRPAKR